MGWALGAVVAYGAAWWLAWRRLYYRPRPGTDSIPPGWKTCKLHDLTYHSRKCPQCRKES
jgi:hypothetical protein